MKNQQRKLQECIDLCQECQEVCQEVLFEHCLDMGGEHTEKMHVKLMVDCIEACQTAANFMRRNSQYHIYECAACAEICEACADSCREIGGEEMLECAEICYSCATSCHQMSRMGKAA